MRQSGHVIPSAALWTQGAEVAFGGLGDGWDFRGREVGLPNSQIVQPRPRLPALMKNRNNHNKILARLHLVNDRKREAPEIAAAVVWTKPAPRFRKLENPVDRRIEFVEEIGSQARHPAVVKGRSLANFPKGWG